MRSNHGYVSCTISCFTTTQRCCVGLRSAAGGGRFVTVNSSSCSDDLSFMTQCVISVLSCLTDQSEDRYSVVTTQVGKQWSAGPT